MGKLFFALGGNRSGKSEFLEAILEARDYRRMVYLATSRPYGVEMEARVAAHMARLSPDRWTVIPEQNDIVGRIDEFPADTQAVLLEDLYTWVGNAMLDLDESSVATWMPAVEAVQAKVLAELDRFLTRAAAAPWDLYVVSAEVGLSIQPDRRKPRSFRDVLGRANAAVARAADRAFLVVAGHALDLRALAVDPKTVR